MRTHHIMGKYIKDTFLEKTAIKTPECIIKNSKEDKIAMVYIFSTPSIEGFIHNK